MLTLGNAVAVLYVTAAVIAAPTAGSTVNGAFSCTVCASTIAVTNRISPPKHTAWLAASPCAALNPSRPAAVLDAAVPPAYFAGLPPIAASNSGPYPGPAVALSQLVKYVCNVKSVRRLTPAGTPANVRLPVLSRRVPVATVCWTPSLIAGIRLVAVIDPTLPYPLDRKSVV